MYRLMPWIVGGAAAVEAKNLLDHNDNAHVLNEWGKSCTYG